MMRVKINDAIIQQLKTCTETEPEILKATKKCLKEVKELTEEEVYFVGSYFFVTDEALYIIVFDDEIKTNDKNTKTR